MSSEKTGTQLQEIAPERVAQWRSDVQSFFATSWTEVQQVIEALEAEIDPLPPAAHEPKAPPSAMPTPTAGPTAAHRDEPLEPAKSPMPAPRYEPGAAAPNPSQRAASAAPPSTASPQDARLAELARRIEERLRQSKS